MNIYYISDIGGSIVLHTFGAYFGLACSMVLNTGKNKRPKNKLSEPNYHSDLFSMVGTVFLWMFWPSFNVALDNGN